VTLLARVLAGLLVAVLLAAAGAVAVLNASRMERSGTWTLAGLAAPVEIRFDARARPYVRAETLGDAFFAQGVLHARERLWQMELLSRVGRGRLAALLGPGLVATDRELWRMGVPRLAAKIEASADATTHERVARYVAGVNAGLAALPARPPELWLARIPLREWTPSDVYALGAALAFSSGRNADNELLRWAIAQAVTPEALAAFLPDEGAVPDFPYVVPVGDAVAALAPRDRLDSLVQTLLPSLAFGSNGWAVAPGRSASGHALFAFDSHDDLALPNLFYEVHLFFGDRSIRGWSVPGLPGVINGFNERMAWGFTNIGDSQDLFLETRHPDDPERFLGPEGWYRARAETVEIPVAGAEPETLRILHTRHGPLLHDDPPLSLAWAPARTEALGLDALFALNLARDWTAASAALDRLAAPSANVTYADVTGRVAFRTVGRLPVRGRGVGLLPLPADEPGVAWRGLVPMADLPRRVDPPEGFVATANARVAPPGIGPLVSADNAPGYRIARIQTVLAARRDHRPEDMRALQMDWRNGQAERLLDPLLGMLGDAPLGAPADAPLGASVDAPPGAPADAALGAPADAARARLQAWRDDPVNRPDAAAPLVFLRWYLALAESLFAERLGPGLWPRLLRNNYVLNHAVDGLVLAPAGDAPWWRGDRSGTVRAAFLAAVEGIVEDLGPDPDAWRWDARHRVHLTHELSKAVPALGRGLDRGPFPWGGGHATVGRARFRYSAPERVTSAATVRVVIEMSDPMAVSAILPGGQAGHPLDPHYDDQIAAWLAGEQDPLWTGFDAAEVGSDDARRLRLVPAREPRDPAPAREPRDPTPAREPRDPAPAGPAQPPERG